MHSNAPETPEQHQAVVVGGARRLRCADVARIASRSARVELCQDTAFRERLARSHSVIAQRLDRNVPTYGVNTGFGASVRNAVPLEAATALAQNLPRYHGCGVGPLLSLEQSRAVLLVRASSLAAGYSGVRPLLVERLIELLQRDILPLIPSRGSVGASGDLTPLSYVAALLSGERRAYSAAVGGETSAAHALAEAGLEPLRLMPKESLAIMNGTSVMAAISCMALERAAALAETACTLTALCVDALAGQRSHFDARIFAAKPHPGQAKAAARIRACLAERQATPPREARIQERYSIRCAPHVIGVLEDALPFCREVLENEINGASDNPLIDPDTGDVLHGGNFYGGHVALVADTLKTAVAHVAEVLERQIMLLNAPETNQGLPENLVSIAGAERFAHHGFKAMEISASALVAEALKLSLPASVWSRSTEGHNQDIVSMGTHAALDLVQVIALSETVAAVHAMAAAQAMELRGLRYTSKPLAAAHAALREHTSFLREDRPFDAEIEAVTAFLRAGGLRPAV